MYFRLRGLYRLWLKQNFAVKNLERTKPAGQKPASPSRRTQYSVPSRWPGILLFALVTLPWYIAVQWRNPEFARVFIVEHNLARFGTNIYHHNQPFWYYVPVIWFGLVPWIILIVAALMGVARRGRPEREQTAAGENALSTSKPIT